LKSVPDVAEVASVGGMVRQYQIVLLPERLRAYGISHGRVIQAVQNANRETGGSVLELGEAELHGTRERLSEDPRGFRCDTAAHHRAPARPSC
jgi:multidrug efflux pump subunit AcrB